MKKTIKTISLILILILVFALPCFAKQYTQYESYIYTSDYFTNHVSIYDEDTINGSYSTRSLDIYNTYNVRIYYFIFSDASSIKSIDYRCDYDYSISTFSFIGSYPFTHQQLSLFYPYQSSSGVPYNFSSVFTSSDCNVFSFYVDIFGVNYQSILGVTDYQDLYYRPDGSHVNQFSLDKSVFSGFSVEDKSHHYYILPVYMNYTFNSEISIPYVSKSTTDLSDVFVIHFNPSFMALCYGNTSIYPFSSTQKRKPLRFGYYLYQYNSNVKYQYSFYNVSLQYDENLYVDITPFSNDEGYRGYIESAYLGFMGNSVPSFSQFKYYLGTTGFVVPIPCDNDATLSVPKFYSGIYKSTSQNFNNLPTYDFEDENINIDYSQYYLRKENWYDFGKDIYNCFIFLIFNIPLLNNVTAPLFMLLNNFIGVWSALVLPLTTVGLVGAFFLFCFIYKTIKKLIGG